MIQELSLTAQTLYAELLDQVLALGVAEPMSRTGGSFISKTVKKKPYVYFQFRELGRGYRQVYIGPDDEKTRAMIDRIRDRNESLEVQEERIMDLARAFNAAGGYAMDHTSLKVIKGFADAGIMRPGAGQATLIGTYAYNLLGNVLGVTWPSNMRTQDIDVAADVHIALEKPDMTAPEALDQLRMGFLPVPQLRHDNPSTSFKIRGKQLTVDLLTTGNGRNERPVKVPLFQSEAMPLQYMGFLLDETVPTVAFDRKHIALVNVPNPIRFAIHKLLVSQIRPVAFRAKAAKDIEQASMILEVCMDQSPDLVKDALDEAMALGSKAERYLVNAFKKTDLPGDFMEMIEG
ncbi:MAG: GSU2403 family nucleotidyltransferase fold protein [Marinobacter sp.]